MRAVNLVAPLLAAAAVVQACSDGDGGGGGTQAVTCDDLCVAMEACIGPVEGCVAVCEEDLGRCIEDVGSDCLACFDECNQICASRICNCPATCDDLCLALAVCGGELVADPECISACGEAIGACLDVISGDCLECIEACTEPCAELCSCP